MRPFVVGFYRAGRSDVADQAVLATWCTAEGYTLGAPYREEDGNGAFDTMLAALARSDVAGVVIPGLDHFGVDHAARVAAIDALGKPLFVAAT